MQENASKTIRIKLTKINLSVEIDLVEAVYYLKFNKYFICYLNCMIKVLRR